jgi:N-acetylmuramoyl-L-alanine amidase
LKTVQRNCFYNKMKENRCLYFTINCTKTILGFLFFGFGLNNEVKSKDNETKKFTVVIDAGHGGKDPGCHGSTHLEKDVALGVALKLGKKIEENLSMVRVVYTRKTDIFLELNERAAVANDCNANLFICIHCNASANEKVYGSETYVMGLHKSKGNLDVAKRENASILLETNYQKNYENFDPNSDEANIIFTMYQNAFLEQSLGFAQDIQNNYKQKACRSDKGVKQAGFLVLWKTSMPSILTETGFLTNKKEEKFLGSEAGQEQLSNSIYNAFVNYLKESKKFEEQQLEKKLMAFDPCNVFNEETLTEKHNKENEHQEPEKTKENSVVDTLKKVEIKLEPEPKKVEIQFKIQFYTSTRILAKNNTKFKDIEKVPFYKQQVEYKYCSGSFLSFEEAIQHQNVMRKKGYKDAFVVAFKNDEKITVREALDYLKK